MADLYKDWLESLSVGASFSGPAGSRYQYLGIGTADHPLRMGSHIQDDDDPWERRVYDVYRPDPKHGHVFLEARTRSGEPAFSLFVFEALDGTMKRILHHYWTTPPEESSDA